MLKRGASTALRSGRRSPRRHRGTLGLLPVGRCSCSTRQLPLSSPAVAARSRRPGRRKRRRADGSAGNVAGGRRLAQLAHPLLDARAPDELAPHPRLERAVGEHAGQRPRREREHRSGGAGRAGADAQRRGGGDEQRQVPAGADGDRRLVGGGRVGQRALGGVVDRDRRGGEALVEVRHQQFGCDRKRIARAGAGLEVRAQREANERRLAERAGAVAGHVADDERGAAVVQRDDV